MGLRVESTLEVVWNERLVRVSEGGYHLLTRMTVGNPVFTGLQPVLNALLQENGLFSFNPASSTWGITPLGTLVLRQGRVWWNDLSFLRRYRSMHSKRRKEVV